MKLILSLTITLFLASCTHKKQTDVQDNNKIGVYKVEVNQKGYVPSKINIAKDLKKVKLLFTRTTDKTCAREVVLEEQNIDTKLPLNKEVGIIFDVKGDDEIVFGCHMDKMYSGRIIKTSHQ